LLSVVVLAEVEPDFIEGVMDEEIGCGLCAVYAVKKAYRRVVLVLAVLAVVGAGGCVWQYLYWTGLARGADERYARAERAFTEQFDGLRSDLADARRGLARADALNRAARAGVERITTELNGAIGNIQEAKRLIGNVRAAVKALEDSLLARNPGDRAP
jgi:hypothetical protein